MWLYYFELALGIFIGINLIYWFVDWWIIRDNRGW